MFCTNCGKEIPDTSKFCGMCGASVNAQPANEAAPSVAEPQVQPDADTLAEEKAFLDLTHRFLKNERLCWKIFGIVWTVFSGLFGLLAIMFLGLSVENEFFAILGGEYIVIALLYLPIAIFNFVMIKKTERYMNTLYNDVLTTEKRCGSIGMIVLSAIFNSIALIFVIINFVRMKNNKALIQKIAARQAQYKNGNL